MNTQVPIGGSGIINGGSIRSEHHDIHANTYNVIIVNLETREALMCHITEGTGFSFVQQENIRRFTSELGPKSAFITTPEAAEPSTRIERVLEDKGIVVCSPRPNRIASNVLWDVTFDLETRQVTVTTEDGTRLYQHNPFPNFVDIPLDEEGLSRNARIGQRLSAYTDSASGELDQAAQGELSKIFTNENFKLAGALLYAFQQQRAVAAGFDDYQDYCDADPSHSASISPDSPELIIRKIIKGRVFERLEASGIDFGQVRITPQAIIELLQDRPEVLIQFLRAVESAHGQSLS